MLWSMQQQYHATSEEDNSEGLEDGASTTFRISNLRRMSISSPESCMSNHMEDMSNKVR